MSTRLHEGEHSLAHIAFEIRSNKESKLQDFLRLSGLLMKETETNYETSRYIFSHEYFVS